MHDLSIFLSIAVLQSFPKEISPAESADYRFLQAVALIESGANAKAVGDGSRAVGAWQMHYAAWIDANNWRIAKGKRAHPRSTWRHPSVQREMAYAFLQVCKNRLEAGGHGVNPVNIALVWNMGYANFDYAKRQGRTIATRHTDYASRVEAIFLHAK